MRRLYRKQKVRDPRQVKLIGCRIAVTVQLHEHQRKSNSFPFLSDPLSSKFVENGGGAVGDGSRSTTRIESNYYFAES